MNLYNNKNFKERRRALRRLQTDAEKKLWSILRNKRIRDLKFFRQYSVGNYILDFYCPKIRLAIEADGGQHVENDYDEKRTAYLKKQNIFVLRFWNNDILNNLDGVYAKILSVVGSMT